VRRCDGNRVDTWDSPATIAPLPDDGARESDGQRGERFFENWMKETTRESREA
jgi:hypothetical protein